MIFALIGAGGHARSIVDIVKACGGTIGCYVSPLPSAWLDAPHVADEATLSTPRLALALGLGGVTPEVLAKRLGLFEALAARGFAAPVLVHPAATVSPHATLGAGTTVMAGAVINAGAEVGPGVIVNTRAVVEHDTVISAGSHIAPGAIVLGAATIGRTCMIGAGAVVLPSASLPDHGFVKALSLYRGPAREPEGQHS